MRRFLPVLVVLLFAVVSLSTAQQPAPTLVKPTLVPPADTGADDALITQSAIARIAETGRVRVGVLYNEPPFGELDLRGEVNGFDAALARDMAQIWGVELRLRQVTQQTAPEMLRAGEVDFVMAGIVHRRDLDDEFEFSQTYYQGAQSMMVLTEDPVTTLAEMVNRNIGVVAASPAERAVADFSVRNGITFNVQTYPTLDRAYGALRGSEIDGIVSSQYKLIRAAAAQPEATKLIAEPVELEPYAAMMLRQDANLRNLVNATIQWLALTGRLEVISESAFPQTPYSMPDIWRGLNEAPTPARFAGEILLPSQYVIPRLQAERVVRIAGIRGLTADAPDLSESERRLETFYRSLGEAMGQRWGAAVEFIPASSEEALNLVATGGAEIAIGVQPDWAWVDRVDFTSSYLLHGLRLMVRQDSNIGGWAELVGQKRVATPATEPETDELAVRIAEEYGATIEIVQLSEGDLAARLISLPIEEEDAPEPVDAVFGDSLKLVPHLQANETFQLTPDWRSQTFIAMAVPRNDIDFRLLVEYTLQELARDGTMARLLAPVMPPNELLAFDIWPGSSEYLGFQLIQQ